MTHNKTNTINYSHNDQNFITHKKFKFTILKQFYRNTITNLKEVWCVLK